MPKACESYYKFLGKNDVDKMMSGSIRLGGFDTYSLLEVCTGDQWIGDKTESITRTRLDSLSTSNVSFHNSSFVSMSYGYCLSMSKGSFQELRKAMVRSGSPYRYDGCIKIKDMEKFVDRIKEAMAIQLPNFGKMAFNHGDVRYDKNSKVFNARHHEDMHENDVFVKPEKYISQSEYRVAVVMEPEDQLHPYLYLNIGDISDIAQEIAVKTSPIWCNPFKLGYDEAIMSLRDSLNSDFESTDLKYYEAAIKNMIYAYGCLRFSGRQEIRFPYLEKAILHHHDFVSVPAEQRLLDNSMFGWEIVKFFQDNLEKF